MCDMQFTPVVCSVECSVCSMKCTVAGTSSWAGADAVSSAHCEVCSVQCAGKIYPKDP